MLLGYGENPKYLLPLLGNGGTQTMFCCWWNIGRTQIYFNLIRKEEGNDEGRDKLKK
jgi:hypothetical protein